MGFIKKQLIGICIGVIGSICLLFFGGVLFICLDNGWGYYFFDVIAKSSPAIAGVIAYCMWRMNREKEIKEMEYLDDYYKKIIDKRMEIYGEIHEKIISPLVFRKIILNQQEIREIFMTLEMLREYKDGVGSVVVKNTWMSDDIIDKIRDIYNIVQEGTMKNLDGDALYTYGISVNEELRAHFKLLRDIYQYDMMNLYKVKEFFLAKNSNKKTS